ncbi:hypothetical protein [Pseudomonas sp. CGJS7]|uniref:hypothetical protein n=1 Tax=Pseudomonas sp. CGJS7 TaxID=3109348 RepID=UPI00300A3AAD
MSQVDFNGLLKGDLLPLLADGDTATDVSGRKLTLVHGLALTVFDHDADDNGKPDRLFATGTVVTRPENFAHGCRWYLHIDRNGIRHESDLSAD